MKKIVSGIVLILFCSAYSQRIAFTPVWRLMLTSNAIVSGKVLSHDTTCIVVEVEQELLATNYFNLRPAKKIKINHSNNAKLTIKSSRILDGSRAIFYLNTITNSENFNNSDRFSASVPIGLNNKIQFNDGIDNQNYATINQYLAAINFVRKVYSIDTTGMVYSSLSKKKIQQRYKMNALTRSIFDEIEQERSQYSN
ncbi:MAG: hypothetical protein H7221_04940 [Flavobacterium sp.]|nr:hypothetical protein [Flavobacterium sp.]